MKFSDYEKTAKEFNISDKKFWRPENGDNRIRLVSGYEAFGSHFVKGENKSYACVGKDEGCTFCDANDKPRVRFLMWVLDRKDGEVKLAEVGYTIIQQIGGYAKDPEWEFDETPDYDINIEKKGAGLETEYQVKPSPNRVPLSPEEAGKVSSTVTSLTEIIDKKKSKVGVPVDENPPQEDDSSKFEQAFN